MTREQRKQRRKRLKKIDATVLCAAIALQGAIQERAALDKDGTIALVEGVVKNWRQIAEEQDG